MKEAILPISRSIIIFWLLFSYNIVDLFPFISQITTYKYKICQSEELYLVDT